MCSDSKKHSRRNFLQILGASTVLPLMQGPAQILIESILMGVSQRANAIDTSVTPRRYLGIALEGAPPRWMHDLFLTPYDATGYVASGQVGTKFEGSSSATSVSYTTLARKGINVPYLWQFNVPQAGGGTRPMDALLDNMLNIRGISVGNPDHSAAQALQQLQVGGTQSLPALAADASPMPIAAVNASVGQFRFVSAKSKSAISVSPSGNMLNTLLTPFIRKNLGGFSLKRQDLGAALDTTIALLNSYAEAMHPAAPVISKSMSDAKDLMSAGFGDLTTTWNNLFGKYNSLIIASLSTSQSLPGINDKPIMADGTAIYAFDQATLINGVDLRAMMTPSTGIGRMAAHFAMAEYILTNNLSSSVSISPTTLGNLSVNGSNRGAGFDEHFTGTMVSLLLNSYYNIAYSACLLELIDRLKAKGIFQETVIVSQPEFGRSAHNDGSGSDHGYMGGTTTIYSGALSGPLVLGNIYNSKGESTNDTGTWGYGAPVAELGKQIDLGHVASTIAFLLRTPSPVTSSSSLLASSSGSIIPIIGKGKQV